MQVYNFCLLGFVLIGYLWPNLQLNTKSNPLFKHIQIDLYDPLRIQHESLPATANFFLAQQPVSDSISL
eukprot:jgi/Chrzof1/2104/Cz11g02260.t1